MRAPLRVATSSLFALFTLLAASHALALEPVSTGFFSDTAVKGYDTVAYFTQGAALRGDEEITYRWKNATWRFANAANRDLFKADPERYAPQYGGYCAYAVSQGYTAAIDPEAWHIKGDKLYLNYSKDVQKTWLEDVDGFISKADSNWPKLLAD